MRSVPSTLAAFAAALTMCVPAIAQGTLSISNYKFVSEQRSTRSEWFVTYRADVVNTGLPRTGLTATVSSLAPTTVKVVAGQNTLHFGSVPTGTPVTSVDTFTILVDRSVPFDFASLQWTFLAPTANPGPNQTVATGTTVTLNGSGSTNSSGSGGLSYLWAFSSKPASSTAVLANATTVSPSFKVDVPGNYIVTLTVDNGVATDSAGVKISTRNSAPVAKAGPNQSASVGATIVLDGTGSSDVDGDTLTYFWTLVSKPATSNAFVSNFRSVSPTFVMDKAGSYVAQLVVNDGTVDSDPSTVTITSGNTAPVAKAESNTATASVGTLVQLSGSKSTDVDGDALTYKWSLTSVPSGSTASLSSISIVNPTFTPDKPGAYVVQLIVNDGQVDSAPSTVTVSTSVQAPTANPGANQSVVAHGTLVTLNGSGTDPQNLPLTYAWSLITKPAGSTAVLSNPTVAKPTFIADLLGDYVAQLIVSNGFLSSAPATVTVTNKNNRPVANAGVNQNVLTGATVSLDGIGSADADGDPLSYSWTLTSKPAGSTTSLSAASSRTPTFFADVVGTYVVQLIVNDGFANSDPSTVTITTAAKNILLSPSPMSLLNIPGTTGTLTLTLTTAAPVGGLTVNLTGFDPSVISLSRTSVTFAEGATVSTVTVTPVAAGTTNVLASGGTYQPATVAVTVTTPSITVELSAPGVKTTYSINGTVRISSPAPAGGLNVALSVSPSGLVSFNPPTVAIAAGQTSGAFSVTGVTEGSGTVTGSSAGFANGTASILVSSPGNIGLASGITVAPGQTVNIPVTLSAAAPTGGVTINLTSSDPTKVTVSSSVTIAAGQTTPAVQPQVTGVAFGSVTILASGGGYKSDSQTVTVGAALGFGPTGGLTLIGATPQTMNLTLSSAAPAGGLTVNLTTSPAGIVTVPATATFAAGATTASFQVTGAAVGTTAITVSSSIATITSASANVTVQSAGTIGLPSGVSVTAGQSTAFQVTLPAAAPAGGVVVTLLASNGKATVPATVTIPAGATTATVAPQVTGVSAGSVNITASSPLYTSATAAVTVNPAIDIIIPATIAMNPNDSIQYTVRLANPAPSPNGILVNLVSSDPAKANFNFTGIFIDAGQTTPSRQPSLNAFAQGSTTITASATGLTSSTTQVTVGSSMTLSPSPLQINGVDGTMTLTLSAPAVSNFSVALNSSNLSVATVPASLPITVGTTSISFKVTAVSAGTTNITATASGYPSASATAVVNGSLAISNTSLPSGSVGAAYSATMTATGGTTPYTWTALSGMPAGLSIAPNTGVISGTPTANGTSTVVIKVTDNTGASTQVSLTLQINSGSAASIAVNSGGTQSANTNTAFGAPLVAFVKDSSNNPVSGATVTFTVPSSGASAVLSSTTAVTNGAGLASVTATANDKAGSYTVSATVAGVASPANFSLTNNGLGATITPTLTINNPVSNGVLTVTLANGPASTVTFSISSSNPGVATVPSSMPMSAGTTIQGFTVTGVSAGTTVITATAAGYPTLTANVTVNPFGTITMTANPASTKLGQAPAQIQLTLNPAAPTGGVTVNFGFNSVKLGMPTSVTIPAGSTTATVYVSGGNVGNHTVTATATGYTAPAPVTIAVGADIAWELPTVSIPQSGIGTTRTFNLLLFATVPGSNAFSINDGISVNISSANTNVATVQSPVNFFWDGSTIPATRVTVSIVGAGVADIHASGINIADVVMRLTVVGPISVTTSSLPSGTVNTAYSKTVTASGGTTPYSWSATGLPAGLTMASATGVISGTPTVSGSFPVTVNVSDGSSPTLSTSASFTLVIANTPPVISTTTLAGGTVGTAYSATVAATGGTGAYSWSATGLPAGLTMAPATGVISGTPTAAGTSNVVVTVTDSATPAASASKALSLVVAAPGLAISTTSLASGVQGTAYSATVAATGGTGAYSWSATGLPAGLTMAPATGVISGTPTAAGSNNVVVTVTDSATPAVSVSKTLTLTIAPPALVISTTSLASGVQGTAYSATVAATGGTGAYAWSATGLPAGLTMAAGTGIISGTPTASGTSSVVVTVTDSATPVVSTSKTLSLVIAPPALVISTTSLPAGVQNVAYTTTVAATGGTGAYTWSATGLPANLTIAAATGVISGTPAAASTSTVVITVTDSATPAVSVSKTLSLLINTPALTLNTTTLANGAQGVAYSATASATGGTSPYSWSATGLPGGLTMAAGTGIISGTPTASGAFTVVLTVTDSATPTATDSKTVTLVVAPALVISTTSLANGVQGTAYSATVAATGGTGAYSWSATGLPAGLTMAAGTGIISGTPTASGVSSVVVTVTDSATPAVSTSKTLSLTIAAPALVISTTSLPNGVQGTAYTSTTVAATGGTGAYSWSATGLPAGVTIAAATGVVSGTPTVSGAMTAVVTVTDSATPAVSTSKTFNFTIAAPALVISTTSLPAGVQGTTYSTTVAATGGTGAYSWSATGLPTGLTMAAATGVISGTTNVLGAASVVVTVTDSATPAVSTSKTLSLTINAQSLVISTSALPAGTQAVAYTTTVAATGGVGAYSWSATGLPAGVTMAAATGVISGTPTVNGSFTVVITVTDSATPANSVQKTLNLTIAAQVPTTMTVSSGNNQTTKVNTVFTAPVAAIIKDANGNGVAGITVTFTTPSSGASGTFGGNNTAVTDVNGIATSGVLTANTVKGTYNVTATAGALTLNFAMTNTAGTPATIAVSSGSVQSTTAGTNYALPLKALVTDMFNNVVSGATVTFTAPGASLPSVVFAGGITAVTDANGVATSGAMTANTKANNNPYTVVASVTGAGTPANFTLTNLTGPAALLSPVSGGGQTAEAGKAFTNPLQAVLTDSFGNVLRGYTVTFTGPATGASASASPNTAVTDNGGVATSGTVTANGTVGGPYNMTASIAGVASTASFALTNTPCTVGCPGSITVSNVTIGQDLQAPILITLDPPPAAGGVLLTITSNDPAKALVGGGTTAGKTTLTATMAEGVTTVSTFVQALVGTGTTTISLSAPGYLSTTATITFSPSGFVITGPNGAGQAFSVFQSTTTALTINSASLSATGAMLAIQQVRGGATVTVPFSSSLTSVGTVSSANLSFTGGTDTGSPNFVASGVNTGTTTLTVGTPSGFATATANSLTATVISNGMVPFSATLGQGLQKSVNITLNGPAPAATTITITSNDPSKLLFNTSATGTGLATISLVIPKNQTRTPDFYVQATATSGTAGTASYTATATGFSTINSSVGLAPNGLRITSPGGTGAAFFSSTAPGPAANIIVETGRVSGGLFAEAQSVSGGLSVSIGVTSATTAVGTIAPATITVANGAASATALFTSVSQGSSVITASAAGYTQATVTANVSGTRMLLTGGLTIGKFLQQSDNIILSPAPSVATVVTITSTDPTKLKLSATVTGAGTASITLNLAAGQSSAAFYVQGVSDNGSASYSATASGYPAKSADFSSILEPSGVVMLTSNFGSAITGTAGTTINAASNPSVNLYMAHLNVDGNPVDIQPLAGGSSLTVAVQNNRPTKATLPCPTTGPGAILACTPGNPGYLAGQGFITVAAGASLANVPVTLVAPTDAFQPANLTVTTPGGYTEPSALTTVGVTIQ